MDRKAGRRDPEMVIVLGDEESLTEEATTPWREAVPEYEWLRNSSSRLGASCAGVGRTHPTRSSGLLVLLGQTADGGRLPRRDRDGAGGIGVANKPTTFSGTGQAGVIAGYAALVRTGVCGRGRHRRSAGFAPRRAALPQCDARAGHSRSARLARSRTSS